MQFINLNLGHDLAISETPSLVILVHPFNRRNVSSGQPYAIYLRASSEMSQKERSSLIKFLQFLQVNNKKLELVSVKKLLYFLDSIIINFSARIDIKRG